MQFIEMIVETGSDYAIFRLTEFGAKELDQYEELDTLTLVIRKRGKKYKVINDAMSIATAYKGYGVLVFVPDELVEEALVLLNDK